MKLLVLRCWWLALVVIGGCFSPEFKDGEIQCGPNDECPPGLSCYGTVCRKADPGIDAAVGFPLTITLGGNMMGTVTSAPAGIDCGTDCMEVFPSGAMVTLTATPMSGSAFMGWSGACSGTGTCTVTIATAINVTANFAVDNSILVVLAGNGSGVVSSNPAGINCGLDCMETFPMNATVVLTASPATGSTFEGWTGAGCTGTSTCTVTADVAKMVTATFSLSQHSLTVTRAGTGTGDVTSTPTGIDCGTNADCSESYPYNTMVTLTATPTTGSTFTGWSGACSGTATCQVTMTQAASVTATFALTTHVLTVTRVGAGTVSSAPTGINCGSGAGCMASFNYNTMVTLSAVPSTGSTFDGWSGGVCTGTEPCQVTMTQARTVTATFKLNKYTLTVSKPGNGSGTVSSNVSGISCGTDCDEPYDYGAVVTLTAQQAQGSRFISWSDSSCSGNTCAVTIDQAKTISATFTLDQHDLTVATTGTGGGNVTGVGISCGTAGTDCTEKLNYNATVVLAAAADAGSTFAGWSGENCNGTGTCEVTMTQARNVTAQFTLNTYLLSVTPSGTGAGMVQSADNPKGIDCGDDCNQVYGHGTAVVLTATTSPGSVFGGWTGCTTSSGATCNVTMNGAKSVTATFTITTPTLSATIGGSGGGTVTSNIPGIDCPGDCSNQYNYGALVTLTATPNPGSTFSGWSGTAGCTGTATSCEVTVNAAKTATATFALASSGLTVSKNGTGVGTVKSGETPALIDCGTDCFENYTNNTTVMLTATASPGSTFSGWSGAPGCTTGATCSVTVTTAMTVTATFTLNVYTLSAARNGTGTGTVKSNEAIPKINCGTTCNAPYNHGSVVTLSATPAPNATFDGWSGGGCTGTGNCVVTVDMMKTVTATFNLIQHNLRLKVDDGGTVASMPMGINCGADCDELYNDGVVVMLQATASPGYEFVGWEGDCTGTNAMCSVTMDGDKGAYAMFAPIQHALTITRNPAAGGDVYSINDGGIDCGKTSCSALYDYGTKVPLKVSPNSGYTFTGWSGACSGTGDCEPTMNADKTVTANFVITTYALTVNRTGNGSSNGTVTSTTPGGITCGGVNPDCTEVYNDGTVVTLSATTTTGTNFDGWTGCNTVSGSTCTVTMNAIKTVSAQFTLQTFALNLSKSGTGTGTVTSSPTGINCGTGCSSQSTSFNYNTAVQLTPTAPPGSSFTSWSGCTSQTGTTCNVTMTAIRNVTATFTAIPPNYMFVTSTTHTGALGGLSGADQICQQRATAASLPGTYRAWLSTSTVTAPSRLGSARGWIRPDGRAFADTVSDITSGLLFYPPRVNESGVDVGTGNVWTGTSANGTLSPSGSCDDWITGTSAAGAGIGQIEANGSTFTSNGGTICTGTNRLLCFGVSNTSVATPPAVSARRAFTTGSTWNPSLGRDNADSTCQSEATAAGLSGTYKALLASTADTALSRFSTTAGTLPWARPDHSLVATTAAAITGTNLLSAPNRNAAGTTSYANWCVWAGAPDMTTVGTSTTTCNNWTSNTSSASVRTGSSGRTPVATWFGGGSTTCNSSCRLYCLQQ